MALLLTLTVLLVAASHLSVAALQGPFVLWGTSRLQSTRVGAIQRLDDETLREIYAEAETIVVFVRNASLGPMRSDMYPGFGELLLKHNWVYLPQRTLTLDPLDFNGNAEIISLVGSTGQQDVEIAALFNDAVNTYGSGKVLAILANDGELPGPEAAHTRRRRASPEAAASTTEEPSSGSTASPTDEPMEENFAYIAPGKAMMYTTAPPQLSVDGAVVELREHGLVKSDERKDELVRLIVTFKVTRNSEVNKLSLRFRFPISGGYWTLVSVELEELSRAAEAPRVTELLVVGEPPSAPLGFSYKCSASTLQFRSNSTVLTLENIQVSI